MLFEQGSCDDIPPPPDPSGCEYPYYFSDGICDDENNNEVCNYDGGDCCGDNVGTTFCSECQCLDPDFGGQGEFFKKNFYSNFLLFYFFEKGEGCQDIWDLAKCQKKMDQGRCSWPSVADKCQNTCGWNCQCTDYWKTSLCEKKKDKGRCNRPWTKKHCLKTCGFC